MKTKQEIVQNWLPRYTGLSIDEIGSYILLVNFSNYVKLFAEWHDVPVRGQDRNMMSATANDITIINFGMGSANAATVMDLLMASHPKACLFLGKCGGLKQKNKLGDLILPIAAIRGEGTSNDYMPPEVPAMPAFSLQKAVSELSAITLVTTGRVRSTRPTDVFGSTMKPSKSNCEYNVAWVLIWKPPRYLSQAFTMKSPLVRYS